MKNKNETSGEASPEQQAQQGALGVASGSASGKLTPEQIKNWRNILLGMIGPYALLMPDADVQMMRDRMQTNFNA